MLDLFLANQQEIQRAYPGCSLVFATDEIDYVPELKELLGRYELRGNVITYETVKPDYARDRIWSIACGREALRRYALLNGAEFIFFMDSDMTYETSVIYIMESKIQGYDVAFSGYKLRDDGSWGFGAGCVMISRKILEKIRISCYEFKNGQIIGEDELIDMDFFKIRARVKKGIFLSIKHFKNREKYHDIVPVSVSYFRAMANSLFVRYILFKTSILVKYNIGYALHVFFSRSFRSWSSNTGG